MIKFITHDLAIGNSESGFKEEDIVDHGIAAVVNVAQDLIQPMYQSILGRKTPLYCGHGNSLEMIAESIILVEDLLKVQPKVLIFCHSGIHRAPAVVAGVLLKQRMWDVGHTFDFVYDKLLPLKPKKDVRDLLFDQVRNWSIHALGLNEIPDDNETNEEEHADS